MSRALLRRWVCFASLLGLCACWRESGGLKISGRIEMDKVHIGSKVGGRVWKVNYDEGEATSAGAVIVALEREEIEAELAGAQAQAAQARAQLDLLLAGTRAEDLRRAEAAVQARQSELDLRRKGFRAEEIREAEAQLVSAKSAFDLARRELERAEALIQTGAIDQQQLDSRRTTFETTRAAVEVSEQRAQLMRSGSRPEEIAMAAAQLAQAQAELERLRNGPRPEEIAAARAALDAAQAGVAGARTRLAETEILAPADARVETLDLQPGDLVKAGQPVAALYLERQPYVRCYLPENRLGFTRPGMRVSVTVDSFPGESFPGIVRRISSEAEFTPRNVQTTEKRSELVFEMKVDLVNSGNRLRAGMYADVLIMPQP